MEIRAREGMWGGGGRYLQASKVHRLTSSVEDGPKSKRAGAEGYKLLSLFLLIGGISGNNSYSSSSRNSFYQNR